MNWTDVLGAIGGVTGVAALVKVGIDIYNAKSNRTTVDLGNMEKMLNDSIARYEKLEQKFDLFQQKSHEYVEGLRGRIVALESLDRDKETRINKLERVVNVAWRCEYPENIDDCPVIKEYNKRKLCESCEHSKEG